MGLFTRYIIAELLKVFLVALAGMSTLMLLVFLIYEAMRQGISMSAALQLIPFMLPQALCFAIPGTILFAVCSVFGRMSSANEVVAIKSMGISPQAIISPILVLSFILSLITVWLNDVAFSWGREKAYEVVLNSAQQTIYNRLETHGRFSNGNIEIVVFRVDDHKLLIRPIVKVKDENGRLPKIIQAESAILESDISKGVLTVIAKQGSYRDEQVSYTFEDTEILEFPLGDVTQKNRGERSPSEFAIREIPAEIHSINERLVELKREIAFHAAFQLASGEAAALKSRPWMIRANEFERLDSRLPRLETETWRRFASGFSCVFFVMVGTPLAIRLRTADVWNSFALCFFPILIVYYPLLAFGLDRAKSGDFPPYIVWVGNIVLGIIGILLYRKVIRY
jgi:lipopolysaccharide export system permease protein